MRREGAGKSLAAVISLAVLSGISCAPDRSRPAERSLQIKGSDTMVNLGQAWAEAFSALHPDVNLAVTGGGSGTGIAALLNGTCDIAESSRAVAEKEIAQAKAAGFVFNEELVALDGIVVVVHPSNPVGALTMNALREIFLGNVRNWRQVGGEDRPVVLLSREVNSGTHIFFKEHVLRRGKSKGPEEFSPRALMMPSSYAIAEEVARNDKRRRLLRAGLHQPAAEGRGRCGRGEGPLHRADSRDDPRGAVSDLPAAFPLHERKTPGDGHVLRRFRPFA